MPKLTKKELEKIFSFEKLIGLRIELHKNLGFTITKKSLDEWKIVIPIGSSKPYLEKGCPYCGRSIFILDENGGFSH